MNRPANIILTILITAAILTALSGAWQLAARLDDCEQQNSGHRCILKATTEGAR